jgi:hypothetical protein
MTRRSPRLARPSVLTAELKDEIYQRYYPHLMELSQSHGINFAAAAASEESRHWKRMYNILDTVKCRVMIPVDPKSVFTDVDDKEFINRFVRDATVA